MRTRRAVTVALLAFVLVAVAAIVVKNVQRTQRAKAISAELQHAEAVTPSAGATAMTPEQAPAESATVAPVTSIAAPAKHTPVTAPPEHTGRTEPASRATAPRRLVRVTYFHTTTRCLSCYKIEALSEAAVSFSFPAALATGELEWRTINTDEPGNEHFIDEYRLFTKSVIVSELVGGKEVRFKNLDQVWTLLNDQQAFARYVVEEVGAFVGSS